VTFPERQSVILGPLSVLLQVRRFPRRSANLPPGNRRFKGESAPAGTRDSTGTLIEVVVQRTEGPPSRKRQTRREAGTQSHGSGDELSKLDGRATQKGGSAAPVRGPQPKKLEAPYELEC